MSVFAIINDVMIADAFENSRRTLRDVYALMKRLKQIFRRCTEFLSIKHNQTFSNAFPIVFALPQNVTH